jgi:CubicO group peptidase (beta-lactamase class C family)
VLVVSFAPFLAADERTDKVDTIFAEWNTTKTPGAALAIILDGEIIYERGYGMAKIEDDIVMTPQKVFNIASMSKQFTAACLGILIQQGKVSLDDDIRTFFPEMLQYDKPILIKHLIYHTSGLRDYSTLLSLAGFRSDSDCPTVDEACKIIFRQKRLNSPPGEMYSYTNTGYFLMGRIIEKVSGQSLNAFAQEHLFNPLKMSHTFFRDDHTQIIKNLATGYRPSENGFKICVSNWGLTGATNLFTSVEDLYLWDQAFYTNELGKDLMDLLQTTGELDKGKKIGYAFGLEIGEYKGLKTVRHDGRHGGYRSDFVRFPEQRFSVICLTNQSSLNPAPLCNKVADVYLAHLMTKTEKDETVALTKEEIEEKVGNYQDQRDKRWISILMKDDALKLAINGAELPLAPMSKTVFRMLDGSGHASIEFLTNGDGSTIGVVLQAPDIKRTYAKVAPIAPLRQEQLAEYVGEYVSKELLNATHRCAIEKDHLILTFRGSRSAPLTAIAKDEFALGEFGFEFIREGEKIVGVRLNRQRAVGIEFERICDEE